MNEKIQEALAASAGNSLKSLVSALTKQLGDTDIAEDDRQQLAAVLELTKGVRVKGSAEGGLVGLSPFASGTLGAAMGLESGGLFTLSQGEFILDNQAAQTFLSAAMILKGQDLSGLNVEEQPTMMLNAEDLSGQNLADLQRDSVGTMQVSSAPIVISAPSTTQINSSQGVMMPLAPIRPSNVDGSFRNLQD